MDEFYSNPPRYEAVLKKMTEIKNLDKNIKLFCIGQSILKRKIYALGIGNLKNAVLFTGAIHAQEWLTCSILLRFFEDIFSKKTLHGVNLSDIFEHRGLIVVPLCNPDGVEIALGGPKTAKQLCAPIQAIIKKSDKSWQANARGVDKALVSLCNALNIKKVVAFHSQGEEIYYYYGPNTPPESELMADALAASSGYQVRKPEGMASHGGFKDWFIKAKSRPGFTVEIGVGQNPLPIQMLEPIYEKIKEMMIVAMLL